MVQMKSSVSLSEERYNLITTLMKERGIKRSQILWEGYLALTRGREQDEQFKKGIATVDKCELELSKLRVVVGGVENKLNTHGGLILSMAARIERMENDIADIKLKREDLEFTASEGKN